MADVLLLLNLYLTPWRIHGRLAVRPVVGFTPLNDDPKNHVACESLCSDTPSEFSSQRLPSRSGRSRLA